MLLIQALSRARGAGGETVVLFGIALFFSFNALVGLLQYVASEQALQQLVFWTLGSLGRATWEKAGLLALSLAITVPFSLRAAWRLTALRLGVERAESFGVNVARVRLWSLVRVSILTGAAVSFVVSSALSPCRPAHGPAARGRGPPAFPARQRLHGRAGAVAGGYRQQAGRARRRASGRDRDGARRRSGLCASHVRSPAMTRSVSLHISGASVAYGRRDVVREVTLEPWRAGQVTALVGPNAAGKSTLLRAIAGLLPARGQMRLDDLDLADLSREQRAARIGFMPQALPAGVALTVMETVIGALRASPSADPLSAGQVQSRAAEVLEDLGIGALALEPLGRLSGGQRQLASLAQLLVRRPDVPPAG